MGGNALKSIGIKTRRIDTSEFLYLTERVRQLTSDLFINIEPVKSYHKKPDHGDIDFIATLRQGMDAPPLQTPDERQKGYNPPPIWVQKIQNCGTQGLYWNDPVVSFELEGVQIDITGHLQPEMAKAHLEFSHYSPIGNVVGRMIKQTGAKWGIDGLSFPVRDSLSGDGNINGCVHLSYDIKDVLYIAGLPFKNWKDGFETQEEMFEWAAQSRLFNKEIFYFENLNHTNRKRDSIRPDYHAWLAFIKDKPNHYPRYQTKEERTIARTKWFAQLCERFPHLGPAREEILQTKADRSKHREKLNGNLIRAWTGLQGKELGDVFKAFKTIIGPNPQDFDLWLTQISEKEAKRTFLAFHQNFITEKHRTTKPLIPAA
jgi:hypothetical protein